MIYQIGPAMDARNVLRRCVPPYSESRRVWSAMTEDWPATTAIVNTLAGYWSGRLLGDEQPVIEQIYRSVIKFYSVAAELAPYPRLNAIYAGLLHGIKNMPDLHLHSVLENWRAGDATDLPTWLRSRDPLFITVERKGKLGASRASEIIAMLLPVKQAADINTVARRVERLSA